MAIYLQREKVKYPGAVNMTEASGSQLRYWAVVLQHQ
jgi:hypothetical protein